MAAHSLLDSSVTLWWMSVCSVMNDSTGSPLLPLTLFVTLSCDAGNQWKHNPEFFLEWETNWLVVLVGSETLRPIIRFLDCGKPESVFFFFFYQIFPLSSQKSSGPAVLSGIWSGFDTFCRDVSVKSWTVSALMWSDLFTLKAVNRINLIGLKCWKKKTWSNCIYLFIYFWKENMIFVRTFFFKLLFPRRHFYWLRIIFFCSQCNDCGAWTQCNCKDSVKLFTAGLTDCWVSLSQAVVMWTTWAGGVWVRRKGKNCKHHLERR